MKYRWIWWVLVILWCIQIFYFTALPVYNDEHTRGFLSKLLTHLFSKDSIVIGTIDYLVRKGAHITVFGILACLFQTALHIQNSRGYLSAWLFTVFYAGTDEWHQSFVPGRTSSIYDVIIDSAGALIFLFCLFLLKKRKEKALG